VDPGRHRQVETSAGPIRYTDTGSGEPLVFVHGVLANGRLWQRVVPLLDDRYRCVVVDWPLGSHLHPMHPDADLSPGGLTELIMEFLDALSLDQVTLVGNDTGGALCQMVAARHPRRLSRLVLTPCDAYENFPPRLLFLPLQLAAIVPGGLKVLLWLLRLRLLQRLPFSFAGLTKRLDRDTITAWLRPGLDSPGIRRDLAKVIRGVDRRYTLEAAARLPEFERPTLIAWAPEAPFFPVKDAERLAADLPQSTLVSISDAYAFVPEDQPRRTAEVIAAFLRATPADGEAA
jgi:pimeloyl-ACP methyl ester carboxylesterase